MLTLLLEEPTTGVVSPSVVDGEVSYQLDRYPRWSLTARLRPDPVAVHLWQSPYGTKASLFAPDGALFYTGPIYMSSVSRPDGQWQIEAADDTMFLRNWRTSGTPNQHVPGTTMDVPAFIRALATLAGVDLDVRGQGGTVDVATLDIADSEGWALVEEQLIANHLDVWPQGDGSLLVAPAAAIKGTPDHALTVGVDGTITRYGITMSRVYNRVVITHEARKDGESDERYVEGVWEDTTSIAGTAIGPNVYTRNVRVGGDWWDDPAGHHVLANMNAAAVAQQVRGIARAATVDAVPDYTVRPGDTIDVTFLKGTRDRFLATGVTWPLAPGAMSIDLRNPDPEWPGSTFFVEEAGRARLHP